MRIPLQDRLAAGIGTAAIVALLGYALLFGLAVARQAPREQPAALVTLPLPPEPPKRPIERPRRSRAPAHASPRNLRAKATPVVAPPPLVPLPPPPPLVVAPKPGTGAAAANGASDRPGPGMGAGGSGDGTGAGGQGSGDGGTPPRQIKGRLSFSDLPDDLRAARTSGIVGVRYDIEIDGRVSGCSVTESSGNRALDAATCRLIEQRFRFRPERDRSHRPVRTTYTESHQWIDERDEDEGVDPRS